MFPNRLVRRPSRRPRRISYPSSPRISLRRILLGRYHLSARRRQPTLYPALCRRTRPHHTSSPSLFRRQRTTQTRSFFSTNVERPLQLTMILLSLPPPIPMHSCSPPRPPHLHHTPLPLPRRHHRNALTPRTRPRRILPPQSDGAPHHPDHPDHKHKPRHQPRMVSAASQPCSARHKRRQTISSQSRSDGRISGVDMRRSARRCLR